MKLNFNWWCACFDEGTRIDEVAFSGTVPGPMRSIQSLQNTSDVGCTPISYTIDQDKHLIVEVWEGEVDADCLEAYWRHYLQDPEVLRIRRALVDLRRAEIRFSGADLDFLIRTVVLPVLQGRDWKTALVVEHPVQLGVSRQYQVFAERYSHDSIFDDLEKARQWLVHTSRG